MNNRANAKVEVADLYTRVARTYSRTGPDFFGYFGRRLVDLTPLDKGASVLDVAAGRGAILFPALERVGPGGTVIGIDLAEGMVRTTASELERMRVHNATMLHMDAEHLAFRDAYFDAVFCGFAIFFFSQLNATLAECGRVLRPGGYLAVNLAAGGDERYRWYNDTLLAYHQTYGIPLSPPGSNDLRDPSDLASHMQAAGFDTPQIVIETAEFVYKDAQEWWQSKWTHGARYPLERMAPVVLEQFKAEVLSQLEALQEADGFHERFRIACVIGRR